MEAHLKEAVNLIAENEGFKSKPYFCTQGYPTIAYGKRLDYLDVDEDTGKKWLLQDAVLLDDRLSKEFRWYNASPKEVKVVVLDLCYQLGVRGFKKFRKTIDFLNRGLYYEASIELLDSLYAKKQTPNRANRNSKRLSNVKR